MRKDRLCKVCGSPASEKRAGLFCDEHLREYRRKYSAKRYAANPAGIYAHTKAWYERNQARVWLAHGAAGYTRWAVLVGLLEKATACHRCGRTDTRIEAAHSDYSRPLDVEWLCRSCHRLWDREGHAKTMPQLGMQVY